MKSFTFRLIALVLVLVTLNGFTSLQAQTETMQKKGTEMKDNAMHKKDKMDKMAMADHVTVINLSETPGEFNIKGLTLSPGQYRFVVTNVNVDHEVGFVIQKASDAKGDLMATAIKPSFTAAPVGTGATQSSGVVTLTPGEYVYSCPLNPTPHYNITVK